jgi:hypothetical protein
MGESLSCELASVSMRIGGVGVGSLSCTENAEQAEIKSVPNKPKANPIILLRVARLAEGKEKEIPDWRVMILRNTRYVFLIMVKVLAL